MSLLRILAMGDGVGGTGSVEMLRMMINILLSLREKFSMTSEITNFVGNDHQNIEENFLIIFDLITNLKIPRNL